jgi:hypothetical protein
MFIVMNKFSWLIKFSTISFVTYFQIQIPFHAADP